MKRAFVIVLDSVGIGATLDWQKYDEEPGNTLCHIAESVGGLSLPTMERLGLGNIRKIKGVLPVCDPIGSWGKAPLTTKGKDTTAGHWEMMGIVLDSPFPTFPQGFPLDLVNKLEAAFGTKIIGLKPASGVGVIEDLGLEHLETKAPIVYTSADSVLQIACHEDVYTLEELYRFCDLAREICTGPYKVGRVIARPFKGKPGAFQRTAYRKDFSLKPPVPNVLEALNSQDIPVIGVGKINDIFGGVGIDISHGVKGNKLCLAKTAELMTTGGQGFYFINLVDFDMLYGHRNDAPGYGQALADFDKALGELLKLVGSEDLLIITADHGNDPTTKSTDHNREYVPILSYNPTLKGVSLGERGTMADIGATVYKCLTGQEFSFGESWI